MLIIPNLFILTIMVFVTVRLIPADVIDTMVAEMGPGFQSAGDVDREVARLGDRWPGRHSALV